MLDVVARSGFRQGLHEWFAFTLAELRSVRRLARTWVFLALGAAVVGTVYGYYSYLHGTASFASLGAGNLLPRFTTAYFNSYVLWFFMAALVFLAFDARHRDARERIVEAVESRPLSNGVIVGGRLCSMVLAIALPLLAVLLLIQAVGTIGRALGWWVDPIEPVATTVFFFLDGVPALILWCAFVLLLAAGLRSRLAAAVAALAVLGIHMWTYAQVPSYFLPAVSFLYIHDNWASDLAPRLPDLLTLLHRASILLLAAALLTWAAALYPRHDQRLRRRRLLLGMLPAALATVGIGIVVLRCIDGMQVRDTWLAVHRAAADEPTPLVEYLVGHVGIEPGEQLVTELEMRVSASHEPLSRLLFSLNPGLEVSELHLDDRPTPFRHEHGLLSVELAKPLASGTPAKMTLRTSGIPDADFAYLDGVVEWRRESSRNAILWLGTAGGIFEKRYVALMPGLRWLPVPGPNLDDASRGHAPTVDLTVEVPPGWLVAGPGRREALDPGRYRFRPGAGVPKVGLFAARFERRAMEVDDVELELLLHPAHLRNLAFFADAQEPVKARLEQVFRDADDLGIPYPYTGFSVVEVPAHLREYGGGHWLDTRMALPGLLLLKEHGFPYSNVRRYNDGSQFADFPGGLPALKLQWLESTFYFPFDSGSALRALSRNLVTYPNVASGPGAHALDYVCEELAREILTPARWSNLGGPTMYTAHLSHGDAGFGSTVAQMIRGLTGEGGAWTGFRQYFSAQPAVWERALGASLADMDFEHDPRKAIGAFALRGNAVARSIFDGLGRERTGAVLAELRRRNDPTYGAIDFEAALLAVDADMRRLIGDWPNSVALPGFLTSPAVVQRVADDEGQPRYEIRVHVRNNEPTPGLARIALDMSPQSHRSDPIRVDGNTSVEIGMVSPEPPEALWIVPYLAHNRVPFQIELLVMDEREAEERPPFIGSRPSEWLPPTPLGIVIDDLDPGFEVEQRRDDTRLGGSSRGPTGREMDRGLPTWTREPGEWTRASIPTGWGKYRRTVAGAQAGDGTHVAVFSAELTRPGRWQLDFHVPARQSPLRSGFFVPNFGMLGSFDLTLVDGDTETPIAFDGNEAAVGWNKLGAYDLDSRTVRLEISSRTDGEMVIADAIRWIPLD